MHILNNGLYYKEPEPIPTITTEAVPLQTSRLMVSMVG